MGGWWIGEWVDAGGSQIKTKVSTQMGSAKLELSLATIEEGDQDKNHIRTTDHVEKVVNKSDQLRFKGNQRNTGSTIATANQHKRV